MKQVCLLCERTSPDSNLYCQEIYCPAEMSPNILDYGEWLGEIEIIKPIATLRSSALYVARQQKKHLLLKVAHPGQHNTERLKREAEFLRDVRSPRPKGFHLPVLLPPYTGTALAENPYGKAMLQGHLLYFCLFEYFPGEPLHDVLKQNPQLWINHIGGIMNSLAVAMAFLQGQGMYHFNLTPESVLLYFDKKHNAPRVLLSDLGIAIRQQDFKEQWDALYTQFVPPAYTAPELIARDTTKAPSVSYATDVYGLGLILYELLVGEPAFSYKLQSDEDVYAAVQRNARVPMNRIEDVRIIADIALQAVRERKEDRQQNAKILADQLRQYFAPPPNQEPDRWTLWQNRLKYAVVILLALAFVITFGITLSEIL